MIAVHLKYLKRDGKIRPHFIDVFALDHFKEFVKKHNLRNRHYICNDGTSSEIGEHWFPIFVTDEKIDFLIAMETHLIIFSLGDELSCFEKDLILYPIQLQTSVSSTCIKMKIIII